MKEPTFSGRQLKKTTVKPCGKHRKAGPVVMPWHLGTAAAVVIVIVALVVMGLSNNAARPPATAYQASLGPSEAQTIAADNAAEEQAKVEAEAASAEYERLWIEGIRDLSRKQQEEMELKKRLAAEAEAEAQAAAEEAARQQAYAPATAPSGNTFLLGDQSPARAIDIYLAEQGSPLTGYGRAFVSAGKTFGVDPFLVVAIMGKESSWGKDCFLPYNGWGWGDVSFNNWEDAIFGYTRMLAEEYIRKGRTDINVIAPIYCPPTWVFWAKDVSTFYSELVVLQTGFQR